MKSRQKILSFLVPSICMYIMAELLLQYNWRADSNLSSLGDLQKSSADVAFKPPLRLIRSDKRFENSIDGFEVIDSALGDSSSAVVRIFKECCSNRSSECVDALKTEHLDPNSFWFFHDTTCKSHVNPISFDNVGYASTDVPDFLSRWREEWNSVREFDGPFKSMHPIVFIRSMNVLTGDDPTPRYDLDLSPLQEAVQDIFEIVHESTVLYGGPESLRAVEESLSAKDPHDQSRLINNELLVWTGSSHMPSFGTFTMPPISYIATVEAPDKPSYGLYQVDHFGFIHIPSNVSDDDPMPDITRVWLGHTKPGPISFTDRIAMKSFARKTFLKNAMSNLGKLSHILEEFHDLAFPQSTASVVDSAIRHIEASLQASHLDDSLYHARIAVIESMEALNDQAVSDPPFFSIEYTFALYAPLALPISVPVLSALIRLIRERRKPVIKKN